ncbi:hypothetical protein Tco_1139537, partial [Tanacetum coccineum]
MFKHEEDLEVEGLKAEIVTLQQGQSSTQYLKADDGKRIGRVKLQGARKLGMSTPRWHSSCQRIGRYEFKREGVGRGAVVDGIVSEIEEFFADSEMLSYSDFRSFVLGTPEHTDLGCCLSENQESVDLTCRTFADMQPTYKEHLLIGTDIAKIARKRSKPDKHGHGNGRMYKSREFLAK